MKGSGRVKEPGKGTARQGPVITCEGHEYGTGQGLGRVKGSGRVNDPGRGQEFGVGGDS